MFTILTILLDMKDKTGRQREFHQIVGFGSNNLSLADVETIMMGHDYELS